MPLFDDEEVPTGEPGDVVLPEEQTLHTNDEFKTSQMFESEYPLENIIREIGGERWEVTYFKQILDVNEQFKQLDTGLAVALQQYNRINHLIIYLQSPISTVDPENITGEAIVNVGTRVFKYDVFLSKVPGGRLGIFEITNVTTKRFNSKEVYDISFRLMAFADADTLLYNNLLAKVTKIYTYDDSYLATYGSPIILQSDYYKKVDLKEARLDLINYYITSFMDKETHLLVEPVSDGTIAYDGYLSDFFLKMVNIEDHELLLKINRSNYEENITKTIYKAVMDRNVNLLKYINTDIGYVQPKVDYDTPMLRSLAFLGVDFVMNDPGDITTYNPTYKTVSIQEAFVEPIDTSVSYNIPFSASFFQGDIENMGILESNIYAFMNKQLPSSEDLNTMINEYRSWDYREQFRLLPFLLLLITYKINNVFSES